MIKGKYLFVICSICMCMTKTTLAVPPCPTTMVWAILTNNLEIIEFLLENGEDTNATLEGCDIQINNGIATMRNKKQRGQIIFWTSFHEIPENPSLLDLAHLSKNQQIIDLFADQ